MKKNILSEVYQHYYCAICESGQNVSHHITPLRDASEQPLHVCEECFDDLLSGGSRTCAYCGKVATYGTWRIKRWNSFGDVNSKELTRVPRHQLLCEDHFKKLTEEVNSRERQSQIKDFTGE